MAPKLYVRGGFSDRKGTNKVSTSIQKNDLDAYTRKDIINKISIFSDSVIGLGNWKHPHTRSTLALDLYTGLFNRLLTPGEDIDYQPTLRDLLEIIQKNDIDDVMTALEFFAPRVDFYLDEEEPYIFNRLSSLESQLNEVFKVDYVGYRFIHGQIVEITDPNQIKAIEQALNSQRDSATHIEKALSFISLKPKPDYQNSIKESITGVESACNQLLGDHPEELSRALKEFENKGLIIHPALKEAFIKLFGYTSDAKGVRHSGNLDSPDATFEEAQFMLVSCSAFIDYLWESFGNFQK
jgi:hypothetical protein